MTSSHSDLLQRARKHLIRYCRTWQAPVIVSGRGSTVVDVDGREYLDFTSGQMCATVGHNHPRVVKALEQSAQRILHLNSTLLAPETIELGERLAALLPPPLSMSIFLNTGSESNEIALKLAKLFTGRFETVGLTRSFHGLTGGAGSSTYAIARRGHGPALPGFALPAPYCYRCPVRSTFPGCDFLCLRAGFELVDAESVGSLAACIVEPVISAGGLIDPPPGYLAALKAECGKRGMIYILDEAQTAFGRLGTMFAFEQDGGPPDILTLSKTFGGGIPVAATVTSPEIEARAVQNGFFHITSHVSDPMPSLVGLAVLDLIQEEKLADAARTNGEYFLNGLKALARRYEIIGDVRGRGLLIGVEFVRDRATKAPAEEAGAKITKECLARGLMINIVQFPGSLSVWRIAPPLTTTRAEIDRALGIIESSIKAVVDDSVSGT
jgi:2,2-dialkylglycine decarboxylase (pyruvate)